MSLIAITRPVSTSITSCELTHIPREPIDYVRAVAQHDAYETVLSALGCELVRLPALDDLPDAVFVEDTAVILDDIAILTRPGAASRRPEVDSVARVLERYRPLASIQEPGTLDGGDVLRVGRRLFVGRSSRTNRQGIEQLRTLASSHGFDVLAVDLHGCLHLKSAVTCVGENIVLGNRVWVDHDVFEGIDWIDVDHSEPSAGNALRIGSGIIFPSVFARTADILRDVAERERMRLHLVDASELAKAEGGVTCCSLVL